MLVVQRHPMTSRRNVIETESWSRFKHQKLPSVVLSFFLLLSHGVFNYLAAKDVHWLRTHPMTSKDLKTCSSLWILVGQLQICHKSSWRGNLMTVKAICGWLMLDAMIFFLFFTDVRRWVTEVPEPSIQWQLLFHQTCSWEADKDGATDKVLAD